MTEPLDLEALRNLARTHIFPPVRDPLQVERENAIFQLCDEVETLRILASEAEAALVALREENERLRSECSSKEAVRQLQDAHVVSLKAKLAASGVPREQEEVAVCKSCGTEVVWHKLKCIYDCTECGRRDGSARLITRAAGVPREAPPQADYVAAAERADWMQVVLNQGPPCFHLEERGKFCLRAERWAGHGAGEWPMHEFVSLPTLLQKVKAAALASSSVAVPRSTKKSAMALCEAHGIPACEVCLTDEMFAVPPAEQEKS